MITGSYAYFSINAEGSGNDILVSTFDSNMEITFNDTSNISLVNAYTGESIKKTFNVKNPIAILLSGLLLGTAAAFLGIGGGPINVAFLTLMFSFTMRDAAVYSVAVIFFSQCANIISTYIKTGFSGFDMKVLLVIIPVAVIGGFIGSILNRKCNEKAIKVTFTIAVSSVAALSLYNAVMSFI